MVSFHVEMDNAVAATYDWQDLDLGDSSHETATSAEGGIRYTVRRKPSEAATRRHIKACFQVLRRLRAITTDLFGKNGVIHSAFCILFRFFTCLCSPFNAFRDRFAPDNEIEDGFYFVFKLICS